MNPFRLDRSEAATADQDHNYTPEQEAFHAGLMDSFPEYTGTPGPPPTGQTTNGLVMGYYDGNTVTALWNYAQRYALNDNSFGTTFGPSSPGAINLVSGQTNGVSDEINAGSKVVDDGWQHNADWRCGPDWRRMLDHHGCAGGNERPEHWRSVEQPRRHLGMVSRRIRPGVEKCQRNHRMRSLHSVEGDERGGSGLHPAPRAVPVLHIDAEFEASAADLDGE